MTEAGANGGGETWEYRFPPEAEQLRAVRRGIGERLENRGCDEDLAGNVALVVDEIVNNAIEHSDEYRAAGAELVLRVTPSGSDVSLEFEDPDVPPDVVEELSQRLQDSLSGGPPPIDNERGRGLFLIAGFVEDLAVGTLGPGGGLQLRGRVE